ncbi:hypothetical protein [Flavobacterium anhuiense]|uniref:hypothetical protein n=1 Tax=Flavobacterium anhuiense TaxID=459526 RepID=UPI000E6C681C|nr:hypothetical protein [Flavobacterium anhuiense]
MTYIEFVGEILKYAGIPALIAIGLKSSFDVKLENLKSELNYLKAKENFKFTKLHEKRFKVLEKTFEYLNTNLNLLASHTSPFKFIPEGESFDENEQKVSKEYRDAHNQFLKYFNSNSIYFDKETEVLLLKFFQETAEIFNAYDQRQIMKAMGDSLDREENLKSIMAYKKIPEIIHPLKKEIEIKFRELLGE